VVASNHRDGVGELQTALLCSLRHTERRTVLNAGEGKLRAGCDRLDVVEEGAETKIKTINGTRVQNAGVVPEQGMGVVDAALALRSGTDGTIQSAGCYVIFALQRIAKEYVILGACLPVQALGAQQII